MDNAAIISGYSVYLPFASDSTDLMSRIKNGERVTAKPWFKSDIEVLKCGFTENKNVATLEHVSDSDPGPLYKLIDEALAQANLDRKILAEENVRVYFTGLGPRVDGIDYRSFYNYNDVDDLTFMTSLHNLSIKNMSQDTLAHNIVKQYHLKYMPPNICSASNSSLTAVHLGCQAIERGGIDLVLVINCSKIKTRDIWFMTNQSMMDSDLVQPFGENSNCVLSSEGISVMLLESRRHRLQRGVSGGVSLKSVYMQTSTGRNSDPAMLSASLLKVINQSLKEAGVNLTELCAIIPHGNGSAVSDKVEAATIASLTEAQTVPVLAYKGQIGYIATGSGVIDLIIGHHSLTRRELLTPVSNDVIIKDIAHQLLTDQGVIPHAKQHLLKIGIGIDGSVISVVMSDTDIDE